MNRRRTLTLPKDPDLKDRPFKNHSITWNNDNPTIEDLFMDRKADYEVIKESKKHWRKRGNNEKSKR